MLIFLDQTGIIFSISNSVYYVTKFRDRVLLPSYNIYVFHDKATTSLSGPIAQSVDQIFNLCLNDDDVITFVTSDDQNVTYVYMQQANAMLRIDLKRRGWNKAAGEVFEDCLTPGELLEN